MEILNATETCFVANDELLNFTLEDEDERGQTIFEGAFASSSSSSSSSLTAAVFGSGLFPEFVEEELQWLSNKDAFPSVDTCFGILSDNPELISNNHSPVSVLTTTSTSCLSVFKVPGKFPVRPRGKRRRRMGDHQQWLSRVNILNVNMNPPLTMKGSMGRTCLHCHAEKTPQWRAGPMGPKTLCNACGVRYKSGRLVPEYWPVNSPTFSSTLHSNSHRKVVEMRRHKCVG